MKNALILVFALITNVSNAQLKTTQTCPGFNIDVLEGTISKSLHPASTSGQIKSAFPCYNSSVDTALDRCTTVTYQDKGIIFYPGRYYYEIQSAFKGKMDPMLLGAKRNTLFSLIGYPKIKDTNWEAFQMQYGTLVLYYDKSGKVNKLQISSKTTETLQLCN